MTEFMKIELKLPIVASSCCITENKKGLERLYNGGVRMAILKTCANYIRHRVDEKREFAVDQKKNIYASSPFEKEILTIEEEKDLIGSFSAFSDYTLIPSFMAASLNIEDWLEECTEFANMGVVGIQLDFFYMSNLLGEPDFRYRLARLLKTLVNETGIEIMPKLNVNLPKDYIIPVLVESGVKYVSLLDSVRSPYLKKKGEAYRIDYRLNPETTSCFGAWQLPLTIGYTYAASRAGLCVCAGGGITDAEGVKKLMGVGASVVQSATYLTKNPLSAEKLFL